VWAECFYNREGLWYYAGSYQAFQLEDLTLKEWTELPAEVWKWYGARFCTDLDCQTANYLVKETISARKNVSPQNVYEVNQLYNAGALRIACVGLECVGFNQEVYKSVLEHAGKFSQAKWNSINGGMSVGKPHLVSRPVSPTLLGTANAGFGTVAAGVGLGNGTTWNTTAALLGGQRERTPGGMQD